MDVLTSEQRRKNMQNIRSKNTEIELILRKALWAKGYRYRLNVKSLPGKPDIVLPRYKLAIFCDSEFFHGKDWDMLKVHLQNSNNSKFWIEKIYGNIKHDKIVNEELKQAGWTVIRFWGEDIRKKTSQCVETIECEIKKQSASESQK